MPGTDPAQAVQQDSIKKSSGPRTHNGKQQSRFNAMKDGIFSAVVVLPGESQSEYKSLVKGLRDAWQPVGRHEEVLVETLAITCWRRRRCLIAEGAEIRLGSEFVEWDRKAKERGTFQAFYKIQSPSILKNCVELLYELRQKIESGFDRERDTAILERIRALNADSGKMLLELYLRLIAVAELPEKRRQEGLTPAQCRKHIVSEIDKEVYLCRSGLIEADREKLEVLRHGVPEPERLDRLLRYEASLERSFDRTVNQLERLQRLRLGQPVAPRIEVTVSR